MFATPDRISRSFGETIMHKINRFLLHLLVAAPCVQIGWAQETDRPLVLDTLTIIGTGLPTEVMTSPASVTVIEEEEIRRRAPVTIATLLRDVPGLQVSEEGIERISLRGEQSRRIAILIDGQALSDHGNYGQPIPVDPTNVERIEIVRGASSVVSGSRAIGGVINIVTKKGVAEPFSLTTTGGWMSATDGWRVGVSAAGTLPAGSGELDYRLSYGRMKQGDRRSPDGVLEGTSSSDHNLSLYTGYRQGDHYFGLQAQAFDLAARVYTGDPDFFIDLPRRDLRKTSLFYEGVDLAPWMNKLSFDIYRQTIEREFRNDSRVPAGPAGKLRITSDSNDDQRTYGANLKAEMQFSPGTRTVAGIEYEDDRLKADKLTGRQPPMVPRPILSHRYDEATIRTFSLFAEHEINLPSDLTATIGGRWYRVRANHDVSLVNGVAVDTQNNSSSLGLGSIGLVWSPDDTMALRANISQGYIYPTLGQLFLTSTGGGNTILGNPDLKPERATTYEVGARLSRGGTNVDVTLFYTDARDYIAYFTTGPGVSEYANVNKARTVGLEIQAEYESALWDMTPYVTAAIMRRELKFANGTSTTDGGAPRLSGRIGVRKMFALEGADIETDLFLRGASSTSLRDETGAIDNNKEASGWATLNVSTSVQWDNGVSLVAEFTNLTNRRYRPFEQAPGAERAINLFLTKSF